MANVRRTPSGRYELRIRSKYLPRDMYFTFDTELEAQAYGTQADALLAAGVVPAGFVQSEQVPSDRLAAVLRDWRARGTLSAQDAEVLGHVMDDLAGLRLADLTYRWVEGWVDRMKRGATLAPGTIRKRVGALARAIDWYLRSNPDMQLSNPLRLLPRGYATYTREDAAVLSARGRAPRVDTVRERRLASNELVAIDRVLAGYKPEGRERALEPEPAFTLLYRLILGTGCRLREAYTLERRHVGPTSVRVRNAKTPAGVITYRDVPLRRELREPLTAWCAALPASTPLVFPFWSGTEADLDVTTSKLSRRFTRLFEHAQLTNVTEHDLRHEATCRWFELRGPDGAWLYREAEIRRIMGWSHSSPMPARYASFRAEDLAARL